VRIVTHQKAAENKNELKMCDFEFVIKERNDTEAMTAVA